MVNKLIYRLHPRLPSILKSQSRTDFLQAAHVQFEDAAKRAESTFTKKHQEFTKLDLSNRNDLYTYYKQQFEVIGYECLTKILEVWLPYTKAVSFSPKRDDVPQTTEGKSGRPISIECVVSIYTK